MNKNFFPSYKLNRLQYLMAILTLYCVALLFLLLMCLSANTGDLQKPLFSEGVHRAQMTLAFAGLSILVVLLQIPVLDLARLRSIGRSGWWVLLKFVPLACVPFQPFLNKLDMGILLLSASGVGLAFQLYLFLAAPGEDWEYDDPISGPVKAIGILALLTMLYFEGRWIYGFMQKVHAAELAKTDTFDRDGVHFVYDHRWSAEVHDEINASGSTPEIPRSIVIRQTDNFGVIAITFFPVDPAKPNPGLDNYSKDRIYKLAGSANFQAEKITGNLIGAEIPGLRYHLAGTMQSGSPWSGEAQFFLLDGAYSHILISTLLPETTPDARPSMAAILASLKIQDATPPMIPNVHSAWPAASTAPQPGDLTVGSIYYVPGKDPSAVINGNTVFEGEQVGVWQVVQIRSNSVTLRGRGMVTNIFWMQ